MGPRLRDSGPCRDRSLVRRVRTRANVDSYTVPYCMQKYRRLSSSAESESGTIKSGTGLEEVELLRRKSTAPRPPKLR